MAVELDDPAGSFASAPHAQIAAARALLRDIRGQAPRYAPWVGAMMNRRTGRRYESELRAADAVSDADWRWLMVANVSYDFAMKMVGCSTAALATERGPVLARNMDWAPPALLAQAAVTLRYTRRGEHRWSSAGWPGLAGVVTGLSARGFAVAVNAVLHDEGFRWRGEPMLLFLRRVLEEAADFDAALRMIRTARLMSTGLITLVGSTNDQRVCVERTPTRASVRRAPGDAPLVTANDYRSEMPGARAADDYFSDLTPGSCARLERLERCVAPLRPADVTEAALLGALTDAGVQQSITAQHIVIHPARGEMAHRVPAALLESPADTLAEAVT